VLLLAELFKAFAGYGALLLIQSENRARHQSIVSWMLIRVEKS